MSLRHKAGDGWRYGPHHGESHSRPLCPRSWKRLNANLLNDAFPHGGKEYRSNLTNGVLPPSRAWRGLSECNGVRTRSALAMGLLGNVYL